MEEINNNSIYHREKGILKINGMDNPIICKSASTQDALLKRALMLSESDVPVLITGETGVGKGIVAEAIHYFGNLGSNEIFEDINCGGVEESLVRSELFGYVKGAFTGATDNKDGIFSSKGTVFLDEIGTIGERFQQALLKVIDKRRFRKVGEPPNGGNCQKLNMRIISATNSELESEVLKGAFRKDLYYRLNVAEIKLPPLREREEEIPLLINHFLRIMNIKTRKEVFLSQKARRELLGYHFPGNVRELENLIQRAVIFTPNGREYDSFEDDLDKGGGDYCSKQNNQNSLIPLDKIRGKNFQEKLAALKLEYIKISLVKAGFNVANTSALMKWSTRSIQYHIKDNDTSIRTLKKQYSQNPDSYFSF